MACPYFYPVARFEASSWAVPPRLPLGDAYTGECRAPGAPSAPDENRMREICNVGYGRGCCDRFPESANADGVRFHVASDRGERMDVGIAALTFRYREGGDEKRITLHLLPESVKALAAACQRLQR